MPALTSVVCATVGTSVGASLGACVGRAGMSTEASGGSSGGSLRRLTRPPRPGKTDAHGREVQERKAYLWEATARAVEDAGVGVLVQVNSLKRSQLEEVRRAAHPDAELLLLKNSAARSVFEATGGETGQALADLVLGPTALLHAPDLSDSFKAGVKKLAGLHPSAMVVGGFVDGAALSSESARDLDSMPSLLELQGQLLGLMKGVMSKPLVLLKHNPGRLVSTLRQHSEADAEAQAEA